MSDTQIQDTAAAPEVPKKHPAGLWVLIFTETFERFSHYGMRALLILYLTAPAALGGLGLDKPRAAAIFGGYLLAIYLFSLSGGQIADRFLGSKRTMVLGGLFIAGGQLLLQIRTFNGMVASLVLIAIGTCMLKPNISASVGRLYLKDDKRRDAAFTLEYMGINIGATVAPIICGWMVDSTSFHAFLTRLGLTTAARWSWAFGISGVGMLLSLVIFVICRRMIKDASQPADHVEPAPRSLGFVALLIPVLLALAWMVIASPDWPVQLLLGAAASIGLMFAVQALISKGAIQTRAAAAVAANAPEEHAKLSRQDMTRLGVVGLMLCFSLTFWFVFQQAGSTLNLFAKDYTNKVVGNAEASAIHAQQGTVGLDYRQPLKDYSELEAKISRKGSEALKAAARLKPAARTQPLALAAGEATLLERWDAVKATKDEYDGKVKALDNQKGEVIKAKGGFEIPTAWFQTINAIFIVALSPLFALLWSRRSGKFPSSPVKFALGLLFAALGFFLLIPAGKTVQSVPGTVTTVGMGWLMGVYLLHTIGELCLSPVGLSYVSKLAPKQLSSQLMGAWFFATGIGSYLAGKAAGFMDAVPLWQLFAFCGLIALVASFILWFVVSRVIHRLMGGHS